MGLDAAPGDEFDFCVSFVSRITAPRRAAPAAQRKEVGLVGARGREPRQRAAEQRQPPVVSAVRDPPSAVPCRARPGRIPLASPLYRAQLAGSQGTCSVPNPVAVRPGATRRTGHLALAATGRLRNN